jgi:acyl dehydratase
VNQTRYFEDWRPGEVLRFGRRTVTAAEIKAFAAEFDPQPFHLDEAAAKASIFGGLVASGWHTAALMMQMMAEVKAFTGTNIAAAGFDDLEWPAPVRPGDTLSAAVEVLECRASESRPDRGVVRFRQQLANQRGDTVLNFTSPVLYWRRPQALNAAASGAE